MPNGDSEAGHNDKDDASGDCFYLATIVVTGVLLPVLRQNIMVLGDVAVKVTNQNARR